MKFFSFESSKKLAEMGCVSKSHYYWAKDHKSSEPYYKYVKYFKQDHQIDPICDAFEPIDFLSSEEYALENCRKLWGEDVTTAASDPSGKVLPGVYYFKSGYTQKRKDMLDAPDQIEFVEEFLK